MSATDSAAEGVNGTPDAHNEPAVVMVHKSAKGPTIGTTTGTAVVFMAASTGSGKGDIFSSQQYTPGTKDELLSGGNGSRNATYFLAVLAPSADAAMAYLANRPPGAHLLVKDQDDNLAVYVKFRQAVRMIVMVKAKEMKKQDEPIEWGRPYRPPPSQKAPGQSQTHSTMMTPVHKIYLAADIYLQLEQCWKRFLPQVKAILLQMCCEPYVDEDAKLDDWGATIAAAQSACAVVLVPTSCGFYFLGTNYNASSSTSATTNSNGSSSSSAVPVRHVEFDFQKFVMVVADGTFNPTAFIISTHFSSKRMFDADITFKLLRDNFLAPDRVMLKETTITTVPVQLSMWQNCVELNSSDPEFTLLATLQSVCWSIIPHEPLPVTFLDSLRSMHLLFAKSYSGESYGADCSSDLPPPTWPKEKIRMAAQISPYLLEMMVAAASGLESFEASAAAAQGSSVKAHSALLFPKQKLKLLHRFARVLRFDIVHMVHRCDEAMLYKFAHHIFQFFSMRCDLPAEFIELVRDLLTMVPEFRSLFLKNQGTNLLWKALHTGDRFQLTSTKSGGLSPIAQVLMQANAGAAKPRAASERRSSLFGIGKKTQPKDRTRKSVDFGTTFAIPVVSNVKPLVFLRINPLLVQSELISSLSQGQLEVGHEKQETNCVGAKYAFCFCWQLQQRVSASESQVKICKDSQHRHGVYTSCKRKKRTKLSPKMCMYEMVLQLSLELLFSSSTKMWERDVGLLLRLENIHESLSNEVMQQMKDAIAMTPDDEMILSPDQALLDQGNYCRLRVVVKCMSDLFRLELKRRNQMKTALGDKKYWFMIHLFRTELREFNDYLESCTQNDGDTEDEEESEESSSEDLPAMNKRRTELLSHIVMFRLIPRNFLDEWIVLSLEDLLQTATTLSVVLERDEASASTNLEHIQYACQLLQIFCLIMRRSTDVDLQTLIVRVLDRGCFPLTALLRQLASAALTFVELLDIRTSYAIQTEILSFLHEFITLDLVLPVRNQRAENSSGISNARFEDVEVLEQRKAVLMASTLSSGSRGSHDEPSMWEYLVLTLLPRELIPPTESASRLISSKVPHLSVVRSFQEKFQPPELSASNPSYYKLVEAFLLLSAQFYSSLVLDGVHAQADFQPCIATHMHYVTLYNERYCANSTQESSLLVRQAAGLHVKCLIALANRRAQFPPISDAFVSLQVIPAILQSICKERLRSTTRQPKQRTDPKTMVDAAVQGCHGDSLESARADSIVSEATTDPAQETAPMLSLKLHNLKTSIPTPGLEALSISGVSADHECLLLNSDIHALMVILVASFLVLEPNFELDEECCPRFAIPKEISSTSEPTLQGSDYDILWTLQQHLAVAKLSVKTFETLLREMESSLMIPTAAQASAIRLLIRLAAPNVFDRDIYVKARSAVTDKAGKDAEGAELGSSEGDAPSESSCTYLTKGAFSTVYRSTPVLPRAGLVAIKTLGIQKRPGDMSVLSNLYNEVLVLKKLQGEPAATQLLDFGNHHEAQNFELMMEYCPCTVNEWRASLESGVPFRSLLVTVLRAYELICQTLMRIHREGVGHFDIKGDNVLVRTNPKDLTRRLLFYEERESFESEATRFLRTAFCFGDFGESMLAESDLEPPPTTTLVSSTSSFSSSPQSKQRSPTNPKERCFFPSRTRGTEAIKSPEMLKIKGGEKEKITFASDIWSLGCLLYELFTQELMFGNDDAAGLYTHLVISDGHVLREDHERKLNESLCPKDDQEKLFVQRIVVLCGKILSRSPQRLSIDQVVAEVRRLLEDILHCSSAAEDKKYMDQALSGDSGASASSERPREFQASTSEIPSLPTFRSRVESAITAEEDVKNAESTSADALLLPPPVMACRLFWNLHLGGITDTTISHYVQSLTRAGAGDRATSATTTFMDAFEAAHETKYDHFVYFLWDNDANTRFDSQEPSSLSSSSQAVSSLVNELSEEDGRTCLFINSEWISNRQSTVASSSQLQQQSDLDVKFFRQLDQEVHQLFPIFQRLLRNERGRSVLLLGVGKDMQAMEAMNEALVTMVLFFLQTTFSLGTAEALTLLARDCGQLFGYPRVQRLLELEAYAARHEELLHRVHAREKLVNKRYVAQCLCGETVFGVQLDTIKDAMYHLQQQYARSMINQQAGANPCFHPFPSSSSTGQKSFGSDDSAADHHRDNDGGVQYEGYPTDPRTIHEVSEERLMFPLEARSRRRDEVQWVEVDIRAIERLDSLFGADFAPPNPPSAGNSSSRLTANGGAAATAPLSSRTAQLSSRSSAPMTLSFRDRKKRRQRQADEQQQSLLAGVGENTEHNAHCGMVTGLTLGLKERAYSGGGSSSTAATGPKPRKLYECELCCFPICAISSDHEKVAIPLFYGRKAV